MYRITTTLFDAEGNAKITGEVVVPNKGDLENAVEMEIYGAEKLLECKCIVEWPVPEERCVITVPPTGDYIVVELHV